MTSFVRLTDKVVVQRERVVAVTAPYPNGFSELHMDYGGTHEPTMLSVQLPLDDVFAKLEVPTIHEELDGLDLVKR